MGTDRGSFEISEREEERFGVTTARADWLKLEDVSALLEFCRTKTARLVIVRCSTSEVELVHELEDRGFRLMDTMTIWMCPLPAEPFQVPFDGCIRSAGLQDRATVEAIAREVYRSYPGHYRNDPNLSSEQCDEAYVDWACRSIDSKEVADEVFVAELRGDPVGFITARIDGTDGEAPLGGVASAARGQGVYVSLLEHSRRWLSSQGVSRMLVRTQLTNVVVQKAWAGLGFSPWTSQYTLHGWFQDGS